MELIDLASKLSAIEANQIEHSKQLDKIIAAFECYVSASQAKHEVLDTQITKLSTTVSAYKKMTWAVFSLMVIGLAKSINPF